ncbi:hypothetical protein CBL_10917 [Carabus blaptoides fortunei]
MQSSRLKLLLSRICIATQVRCGAALKRASLMTVPFARGPYPAATPAIICGKYVLQDSAAWRWLEGTGYQIISGATVRAFRGPRYRLGGHRGRAPNTHKRASIFPLTTPYHHHQRQQLMDESGRRTWGDDEVIIHRAAARGVGSATVNMLDSVVTWCAWLPPLNVASVAPAGHRHGIGP